MSHLSHLYPQLEVPVNTSPMVVLQVTTPISMETLGVPRFLIGFGFGDCGSQIQM